MSNDVNSKEVAVNNLEMSRFRVQKGLRVSDVRKAFADAKYTMPKLDSDMFRSELAKVGPKEGQPATEVITGTLTEYFESVLAPYDGVRNVPADVARFVDERKYLNLGLTAAIATAQAMDEEAWKESKVKEPTTVNWKGTVRNAFEVATEVMEPQVAAWAKALDKDPNPNALYAFCNAVARALGKTGSLRPEKVEADTEADAESDEAENDA